MVEIRFARSSRRHRIGRAHALAALADAAEPEVEQKFHDGALRTYLHWLGTDDRGVELEITGRIADENQDLVIVIHVMPTMLRNL